MSTHRSACLPLVLLFAASTLSGPAAWADDEAPSAGADEVEEDQLPAMNSPHWDDFGLRWYEEAYAQRKRGDLDAAREAFEKALDNGADEQLINLELGYLGKEDHDLETARARFEEAAQGSDRRAAAEAGASLVQLALLRDADGLGLERSERVFWLNEAMRTQDAGLWEIARRALDRAQQAGADPQLITLELAYLEARAGDLALSRAHFEVAAMGPDAHWAGVARRELAATDPDGPPVNATPFVLLQQAWRAKERGDWDSAVEAFEAAAERGADRQRVDLELGYVALKRRDRTEARNRFGAAAMGEDAQLAEQARRELVAMRPAKGPAVDPRRQPWYWLEQGWHARDRQELDAAQQAFATAADLGASPQRIALELGYLDVMRGETERAMTRFEEAAAGEDPDLTAAARAQLDVMQAAIDPGTEPGTPAYWMGMGWEARDAGELDEAREAFFYARELGAPQQRVALELGYVAMAGDDPELALLYFEEASLGEDPALAALASAERDAATPPQPGESVFPKDSPEYWLEQGWKLREDRDYIEARKAFLTAQELGADEQLVALELGYNAMSRLDRHEAWRQFGVAAEGPDAERAAQAEGELEYLDGPLWADLYGDTYGWWRLSPERKADLVPLIRLRGYWTPFSHLDLHAYAFLQASRDMASRGAGETGAPIIYADNTLMFGPGVLARFFGRRLGIYAQFGPALNLVDDGTSRWEWDARVAAYTYLAGGPTHPGTLGKGEWGRGESGLWRELYGEAVYVSRFDHNVIAMARGRAGLSPLVSGKVAWQPLAQARAFVDLNGDYYNNRADLGVAHRWRWQTDVPLDLLVGFNVGSYYGRENVDEAPDPLVFTELWLQAVTYYQF